MWFYPLAVKNLGPWTIHLIHNIEHVSHFWWSVHCGSVLCGGVLCGGVLCEGVLCGGVLCGGVLCGGVLCGVPTVYMHNMEHLLV